MKKPSHNRRRRPSPSADARPTERGSRGRTADDHAESHDADHVDRALVEGAAAEEELADNDLADVAMVLVDRVRPYFSTILAGLAAVLAAVFAYGVMQSQAEATRTQSWDACLAAISSGDTESFNEVIRRYPGTDAARWAGLLVADATAAEGTQLLFVDRQRAEGRLQAAIDAYSALLTGRPKGLLGERVVFGLAKARESLGELAEARRGYEAVVAEFPADALAGVAVTRAAELGRESTRQWYDWFGAQKISPPASETNAASPAPPAPAAPSAEPDKPADANQ